VWGRFEKSGSSALARLLHAPAGEDPSRIDHDLLEDRLKTMSDDAMRDEVRALCAKSEGTIALRDLTSRDGAPYRSREPVVADLALPEARREVARLPRMSSFTQLVRHAESTLEAEAGIDRDEQSMQPASIVVEAAKPVPLAEFPAGPKAGIALHAIFEHADFRRADPAVFAGEVHEHLDRFGFDAQRWGVPVAQALGALLDTPLDAEGVRLADVARADRADEMEFMLPIGSRGTVLDPWRLADVLRQHGAPAPCPDYHARVATLGFPALRGHLKGFVDLVFRQGGRYHLVDYKSNWLGTTVDDYRPSRLAASMAEHHYPLQYLIYLTALHRFLGLRVPDYDYDTHVGNVYYLFVRGIAPGHPLGTGVYRDRPSRALIEALAALLDGSEAAA